MTHSLLNARAELERATRLLNEGKYADCAAICGAIVARDAGNSVATHLLGLAIKETGDWEQGEQWLRLSVQLDPGRAEFHANLGNLLRRRQKFRQAESFYRQAVALAPNHLAARRGLALTLNDLGRFTEAEVLVRDLLVADERNAETWVLLGLTLSNLQRLSESEAAYRQAIALDPQNRIAHHNLGAVLSQMEKPEAAFAALQNAGTLGQDGYELAFNRGRALLDLNNVEAAEQEFERATAIKPSSVDAQLQLARVRYMLGDPMFARSLAAAAAANRDDVGLQQLFAEVLWRAGKLSGAEAVLQDLVVRKMGGAHVLSTLAAVLHEGGRLKEAESFAIEAVTAAPADAVIVENLVSILLSRGRPEDAMPFIRTHRMHTPNSQAWVAYEATAARLLGTEIYPRLYDYDRLIRVFDVEAPAGWSSIQELNAALVQALGERHRLRSHPLDQSLRNGTQTSRSLLAEADPAIKAILAAFEDPIREYRQQIGTDMAHPLSARNTGESRFTGAWSVRLRRCGYHVNHFHPDGWISSAYYVDVPSESADLEARSGWIKFGEPRYEVPGAVAERFVQPRPGRLVLFPSYMWHGTTAIQGDDPRLTIAFDVKPG
jgi:Flp pilus assembly protein TadD